MTGLERAIRDEDLSQIRKLLNKNNLNRPDSEGITPLLAAAIHGRIKSAKAILKRGADVNKADNSGNTPLMFAAKNGNLELLQLLLYFSADVSLRSKAGKTAFGMAVFNDKHECAALLNSQVTTQSYRVRNQKEAIHEDTTKKEKNSSIMEDKSGAKDIKGKIFISIFEAIDQNNTSHLKKLLNADVDLNKLNNMGETPLTFSITHNKNEAFQFLLAAGADINLSDKFGYVPIFHASLNKRTTYFLDALIAKGANVNQKSAGGQTPMHGAASSAHANLLLANGAYVDERDAYDNTPLFNSGTYETVKLLINHGADINAINQHNQNALHSILVATSAARSAGWTTSNLEVIRALIEEGINIENRDNLDNTPIITAAQLHLIEPFIMLYDNGADLFATSRRHDPIGVWYYIKHPSHPLYKSNYYYALQPKSLWDRFR